MGQSRGSKRKQKELNRGSLKGKAVQQAESGLDLLLSDELKEKLLEQGTDADQVLIIPGTKKKSTDGTNEASLDPAEPALSKAQLRKLKQIQMKKERRENLSQVLDKLHSSSIADTQLALMRPLHQRGAKETKKQRLKRILQLQRAGVKLSAEDEALLYRPRKKQQEQEEQEADSSESEEDAKGVSGSNLSKPTTTAAAVRSDDENSDSQGSEADEEDEVEAARKVLEATQRAAMTKAQKDKALLEEAKRLRRQEGLPDNDDDEEDVALREAALKRAKAAADEAAAVAKAVGGGAGAQQHRVVHVERPASIQEKRLNLPILAMESDIVEAVAAYDAVVLCGETGCGKTTQVPQFLLEAGYGCTAFPERAGCIGVTQPRRVAATSTAARVAEELGHELGETVGYQVRYDRQVGDSTRIKFMTDGILLRELQEDFLLSRYSVLLVDEAHERSLNTDLLLGMLSRVVPLRRKLCMQQRSQPGYNPASPDAVHPLKLIIMSATLRTADFVENQRLFPNPPPVINVPARQFPVTVHFSRKTEMVDYVSAAFRKVVRIHRELPPGGVLVFLTGQREVEFLCKRLRNHFQAAAQRQARAATMGSVRNGRDGDAVPDLIPGSSDLDPTANSDDVDNTGDRYGEDMADAGGNWSEAAAKLQEAAAADDYDEMNDSGDEDEEDVHILGGDCMTPEEIAEAERKFEEEHGFRKPNLQKAVETGLTPTQQEEEATAEAAAEEARKANLVHVLPLYAMLPAESQARVFQPVPLGHRLIVVATNVAETSLTIPGIRYVVDAGRSKQRLLEQESGGTARFEVRWTSQAACAQRAGRAGRTCPGHCYRLFSSAHFNDTMPRHTPPEIANTALEGVVLVLKSMGVEKVHNFPFPTPPEASSLKAAEQCLIALSALDPKTLALTDVGRAMSAFPIGPRHARMLLEVAAWQLRLEGAAVAAAKAAGSRPPPANTAAETLPYAVALAAALTVESPFMHLDSGGGKNEDEQDGENGNQKNKRRKGDDEDDDDDAGRAMAVDKQEDKQRLQQQRLKQQRASAAHATLRCHQSDALSSLRALCAYLAAEDKSEFCERSYLHQRFLQEAADLHRQLIRILASPTRNASDDLPTDDSKTASIGSTHKLLTKQLAALAASANDDDRHGMIDIVRRRGANVPETVMDCLRRAMAVGWADSIARRVRSAEFLARQQAQYDGAGSGKRHAVRYVSCAIANAFSQAVDAGKVAAEVAKAARAGVEEDVTGDVFLHPRSALHRAAPEYVAYTQLVRTSKRPYMSGSTAVQPEWLVQSGTPLAAWSEPLLEPAPLYRAPPTDAVLAWHQVTYGRHSWALPPSVRQHPDPQIAAAVFAAAFLDGKAVKGMEELKPLLISAPAVAARPEMRGVARVGELVDALAQHKVTSSAALCTVWKTNQSFLYRQVLGWLPKQQHAKLAQVWPGIVQQGLQALAASKAAMESPSFQAAKVKKVTQSKDNGAGQKRHQEQGQSKDSHAHVNGATQMQKGKKRRQEESVAGSGGARDATSLAPQQAKKKKAGKRQ